MAGWCNLSLPTCPQAGHKGPALSPTPGQMTKSEGMEVHIPCSQKVLQPALDVGCALLGGPNSSLSHVNLSCRAELLGIHLPLSFGFALPISAVCSAL